MSIENYFVPCPKDHQYMVANCCKQTQTQLPPRYWNVLLDFIGCRGCQYSQTRLFHIELDNVKQQDQESFMHDIIYKTKNK